MMLVKVILAFILADKHVSFSHIFPLPISGIQRPVAEVFLQIRSFVLLHHSSEVCRSNFRNVLGKNGCNIEEFKLLAV